MKTQKKSIVHTIATLIVLCLVIPGCNGGAPQVAEVCNGDLYVESQTVTRVTPAPNETYADNSTHTWSEPPYGVEVTGSGEAVLRVYYGSTLLSEYRAYAAGVKSHAQFSVEKWNGSKDLTLNAGNFVINDTDNEDVCTLNVSASQVGISSIGTKYLVSVRPEINEVKVVVLDGVVMLTSLGQTVTLTATESEKPFVAITNGEIGIPRPVIDPGILEQDMINGLDINPEIIPTPESLNLWTDERLLLVLEEIAARFEADTGIKVQIQGMPLSDIPDQYLTAALAGGAPDLVTLPHMEIYQLLENGLLLPLETRISPDLLMPGASQAFNYKSETFGVPYVYENLALVSNTEYISGIPPTWTELRSYVAEISAGKEFFTGLMIPSDGYYFYPVQSAFGGYIFGTDADGTFNVQDLGMSSDGSQAAANWLAEMVYTQPVFQGDEETALKYFQERTAAMIVTGSWSLPRLREMGVPFQVNSFPAEMQGSHPFLTVSGFAISRDGQNKDYAQKLLWDYLTTYEAVQAYSKLTGAPPARRDVLEKLEDSDLRAFGFAGEFGIPLPFIPEMNYVWGPWTDAIRNIISKEMPGYQAFINADGIIRTNIGR